MTNSAPTISINNLDLSFGSKQILYGINLNIIEGELFGLLGPNGAGKTTLFRTIAGLLKASNGNIKILGDSIFNSRIHAQANMTYLPGDVRLYNHLSGAENLKLLGSLHNVAPTRQSQMLELFDFKSKDLNIKVRNYSSGMRQKIALVATFQHDLPLYILDEPTTGLDPLMQAEFAQFIESESKSGKTILLSSHTLSEVERICERVAVIKRGRIVFNGKLDKLRQTSFKKLEVVFEKDPKIDWGKFESVEKVQGTPRHRIITFSGNPKNLLNKLAGLQVEEIRLDNGSLEEAFKSFYRDDDV